MPPELSRLHSRTGFGAIRLKRIHFVTGNQISNAEIPEFRAGKPVIPDRRGVVSQEPESFEIEDPHRQRIFVEQKAILFLGLSEFGLPLSSQGDFPVQLLVGVIKFRGSRLDLGLQLAPHSLFFHFNAQPLLEQRFDMDHSEEAVGELIIAGCD